VNCPGTCNAEYRKLKAIYDDAVRRYDATLASLPDGAPVPDPPHPPRLRAFEGRPVWCGRCASVIRIQLAELDELAALLAALPPGIRPASDTPRNPGKVDGTPAIQSPSPAGDDLDELERWLAGWERDWRHARGWPSPPKRGVLATPITTMVAWLGLRLDAIVADADYGERFGLETFRWHRVMRRKSHAASFSRFVRQPCPSCKRYTLWEKVGEPYISCVYEPCARRLTREDLERESA